MPGMAYYWIGVCTRTIETHTTHKLQLMNMNNEHVRANKRGKHHFTGDIEQPDYQSLNARQVNEEKERRTPR